MNFTRESLQVLHAQQEAIFERCDRLVTLWRKHPRPADSDWFRNRAHLDNWELELGTDSIRVNMIAQGGGDTDYSSFTFPLEVFIADDWEARAEQHFQELDREYRERKERAAREAEERRVADRRRQYEALRKEFGQ